VGQAVRAVGGDLDVEDGVARGQDGVDRGAEGRAALEDQEPGVVVAQPELAGRAHHAVRELAADLRLLDPEVAGQDGAGERHRHAVADLVVLGAADDRLHARGPQVDRADRELVGVRVLGAGQDLADHDGGERRGAGRRHVLHLEAEEGDGAGQFRHRRVERHVVLDPVERDLHAPRIPPVNCLSSRRSFW
jgi:hypothetical protein